MINYDLRRISTVVFDVDGVLSRETITLSSEGEPLRTVNIKDGYAIQLAVRLGLRVAIITGGDTLAVRRRYERLGVTDLYMGASAKLLAYEDLKSRYALVDEEILFMGDDVPDLEVLSRCGLPCAPQDACSDVLEVVKYVSSRRGGEGCARDVIEQVLRTKGLWRSTAQAFGW